MFIRDKRFLFFFVKPVLKTQILQHAFCDSESAYKSFKQSCCCCWCCWWQESTCRELISRELSSYLCCRCCWLRELGIETEKFSSEKKFVCSTESDVTCSARKKFLGEDVREGIFQPSFDAPFAVKISSIFSSQKVKDLLVCSSLIIPIKYCF